MFDPPLNLSAKGLFVTATDTAVGKTVVTSGIAAALRQQLPDIRLGVSKPFASECRRDREGLVNADTEAIAHFSDCRLPLDVINPIRYGPPLAPGVAEAQGKTPCDMDALRRGIERVNEASDHMLVEGAGGLLVPLTAEPMFTVLDLIVAMDFPVLIVARSLLGTLNHTAMTVQILEEAGARVAGVVMNGYDADARATADDPSIATNREWITRMTGAAVLAVVPKVADKDVQPHKGVLDGAVIDALSTVSWPRMMKAPRERPQP